MQNNVPNLIHSIKAAGLLLITIGQFESGVADSLQLSAPTDPISASSTASSFASTGNPGPGPLDPPSPDAVPDGAVKDGIVSC